MDKSAVRTLFDAYWSSAGWRRPPQVPTPDDFQAAKSAGVMFDPVSLDHDGAILRIIDKRDAVRLEDVADAFVASLSTRRLDLRSALGSYAVFRYIPKHTWDRERERCPICGLYAGSSDHDLNVLNFERLKWGGVRHDQPVFASLDLELFLREDEKLSPTRDDVHALGVLLETARTAADTSSAQLEGRLSGLIKSNKQERDVVIAILGFCGILETQAHRGYRESFVADADRALPDRRFVDMPYPACWWSSSDGVNEDAAQEYFGRYLS